MMDFHWTQLLVLAICYGAGFSTALLLGLKGKVSGLSITRGGVEIRTNDVHVWGKITDKLERIDTNTRKSIRKATTGLSIIAPERYGFSTEIMLVNYKAQLPLIFAAYENHHTREIASDGGTVYLAEKTNDMFNAVMFAKNQFPELTEERCESLVCYWYIKIVAPIVRKACLEKSEFYSEQRARHDISQTIKEICTAGLTKNKDYITCIDQLCQRPDVEEKSSIIYKGESS